MNQGTGVQDARPVIKLDWQEIFTNESALHQLENFAIPAFLKRARWFGGKARVQSGIKIYQIIPIPLKDHFAYILLVKVRYPDGPTEIYTIPCVYYHGPEAAMQELPSDAIIARVETSHSTGYMADGIYDEGFRNSLYRIISKSSLISGKHYPLKAEAGALLLKEGIEKLPESRVLKADQSNSALVFNDLYFMKLFRKVEYARNPDEEIIRFLTNESEFNHIPRFAGSISIHHPEKEPMLLCMMQQMVPNEGSAWEFFMSKLWKQIPAFAESHVLKDTLPDKPHTLSLNFNDVPLAYREFIDEETMQMAALLGKRTGEMHLALANANENNDFEPIAIDSTWQQGLKHGLSILLDKKFELLRRNLIRVPDGIQEGARIMLEDKQLVHDFFDKVLETPLGGKRIRIHGDFHLGQVLVSDNDVTILDFEGEPDKPHAERRLKYPPLKDVAGMMRSFRYAGYFQLFELEGRGMLQADEKLMQFADFWYHYVSRSFLGSYLSSMKGSGLLPEGDRVNDMLQVYTFEKAVYEMGYEINNRPDWVVIPLQSLVKFVRHYIHRD